MNSINTATAKTSELVDFYNANSGKSQIKKFADRATAEKRVNELLTTMNKSAKIFQEAIEETITKTDRSAAIAKTWADPEVKAARSTRTHVKAGSKVYRSVKQAFEELGLPLSKHIRFRMELKSIGEMTFQHNGKSVKFHIEQE
jgi:predicted DNA-binding WGR domain protein